MLSGLDLFSGIGGISLALAPWVKPAAYCENDRYAQAVLLSRMRDGSLSRAPIWDDITTLLPEMLPRTIDIIYGGFPCQDISSAGLRKGLEGKRSGLFFEIVRLVSEIRPSFIFLENVAAITVRGLGSVTAEITKLGYDCRWTTLSAAEIGANHKRDRWWLLGYSNSAGIRKSEVSIQERSKTPVVIANSETPYTNDERQSEALSSRPEQAQPELSDIFNRDWWSIEPNVGRVVNGLPHRVDRIRGLGNAVVPLCAREAFKELMGIDHENRITNKEGE